MAAKRVLVPIGNGSEDIESVTLVDVLRRAGAEVTLASVESGLEVTFARKVKVLADALIGDLSGQTFDLVALPGGMPGAERLRDSAELLVIMRKQKEEGRLLAAVCASPSVVLHHHGLIGDAPATAHPGFSGALSNQEAVQQRVVRSGTVITSRGPGTTLEFALRLVAELYDEKKALDVAGPMVVAAGWEKALE